MNNLPRAETMRTGEVTPLGRTIIIEYLAGIMLIVSYSPTWVGSFGISAIIHATIMATIAVLFGKPLFIIKEDQ